MDNIIDWPENSNIEEEAAQWIILLDSGEEFSEENRAALSEWLRRSPEHAETLKKLNAFWADNSLTELLEPALASVATKVDSYKGMPNYRKRVWQPIGVIGVVLVLGFAVMFGGNLQNYGREAMNGPYSTAIGQQKQLELPDGSVLELNTNSQLIVEYGKDARNIRLIQGEVYFNVAKDSSSPFRVYARSSRVQAVGTAFTVYLADRDVEVYVTEGRVALAALNNTLAPSAVLEPDSRDQDRRMQVDSYVKSEIQELGTLDRGRGVVLKVSEPTSNSKAESLSQLEVLSTPQAENLARRLAWRKGLLIFSGETLEQVVAEIRRYTTVQIELVGAGVKTIEIAGQVHISDPESMFKSLESNFGLKVNRLAYNHVQVVSN